MHVVQSAQDAVNVGWAVTQSILEDGGATALPCQLTSPKDGARQAQVQPTFHSMKHAARTQSVV